MEILKNAVAGTLESSDVYVKLEPCDKLEIAIESVVIAQFGEEIKNTVMQVLNENSVTKAKVFINDRGAIDCTIKARVETALNRAAEV